MKIILSIKVIKKFKKIKGYASFQKAIPTGKEKEKKKMRTNSNEVKKKVQKHIKEYYTKKRTKRTT